MAQPSWRNFDKEANARVCTHLFPWKYSCGDSISPMFFVFLKSPDICQGFWGPVLLFPQENVMQFRSTIIVTSQPHWIPGKPAWPCHFSLTISLNSTAFIFSYEMKIKMAPDVSLETFWESRNFGKITKQTNNWAGAFLHLKYFHSPHLINYLCSLPISLLYKRTLPLLPIIIY